MESEYDMEFDAIDSDEEYYHIIHEVNKYNNNMDNILQTPELNPLPFYTILQNNKKPVEINLTEHNYNMDEEEIMDEEENKDDSDVTAEMLISFPVERKGAKVKNIAYVALADSGATDNLISNSLINQVIGQLINTRPKVWHTKCGIFHTTKKIIVYSSMLPEFTAKRSFTVEFHAPPFEVLPNCLAHSLLPRMH